MAEDTIKLIKKLLRLAKCSGATPDEAANALNKALGLMEKHHIDIASLDLDEETESIVCEKIDVGSRVSLIRKLATSIVETHFGVKIVFIHNRYAGNGISFVGFEHDVTVAIYVYAFIVRACTRSLSEYSKAERKARRVISGPKRVNFTKGWMYGLSASLRKPEAALDDSKTAIVLATRQRRVEDHFSDLYPNLRTERLAETRKNSAALRAGFRSGNETTIHKPLGPSAAQPLLLE